MKATLVIAAAILVLAGDPKAATSRPAHPAPSKAPRERMLGWIGEPISLDLKDVDLRDVLHIFSRLTGLNVAVDPEVKGSVTVRLHDVAWDQALDLILQTNGFGYVLDGNILRVGLPSKLSPP